jgi:hypothetical protein
MTALTIFITSLFQNKIKQFSLRRGAILLLLSFLFFNATSQTCSWAKSSDGDNTNFGACVCADTLGNVYVTGTFQGTVITFGSYSLANHGTANPFLVKYSPNGTVLWARSGQGQGNWDKAFSVTTDKAGNVFICGFFTSSVICFGNYTLTNSGSADFYIAKYDPNGNVLWANKGGAEGVENIYSVSTDSQGNVYTVGYSTSSVVTIGNYTFTNNQNRMLVVKYYGSNGNVAWAKTGIGDATAYAVHADKKDNVYITGEFYSPTISIGTHTLTRMDNDPDFFVVKLDTSGSSIWAKNGSNEYGYSITSNPAGDIFVFGNYYTSKLIVETFTLTNSDTNSNYDNFLVKYDSVGNIKWVRSFGNAGENFGYSVASDMSNLYIIGSCMPLVQFVLGTYTYTPPQGSTLPLYFARLDYNGNVVFANIFSTGGGTGAGAVQAWACTDKYKNVYLHSYFDITPFTIGTYTLTQSGYSNIFLAKFHFGDVGIKENSADYSESILYPNPNSGEFSIKISENRKNEKLEIAIFDITGRLVWTKKKAVEDSNEFQLKNDLKDGMYLVKVKFDDGTYDIHHLIISK